MDAGAPQTNGRSHAQQQHHSNGTSPSDLSQVLEALQAIYSPASSNDTRRQATEYLEQAKRHPDAHLHGHTLALDQSQPAQLRHYGLTVLEYSIKYNWEEFSADGQLMLRGYVVELAGNVTENDAAYLRNKIAQLWTEIAKRSWGAEWLDMDQQLVTLWTTSLHHQAIVLYILETLSEEIFNREDPTAGLRGSDLGRACVDIFTPLAVMQEHLPSRDKSLNVRYGEEGWLTRLCDNLGWCLGQDCQNQEAVRTGAIKTMNALRAAMPWIIPKAISATHVIESVCKALSVAVVELQLAAVDVLQAIYSRHHLHDDEFVELVCPMFTPASVSLLRDVYNWTLSDMNINDLDDQKYTLCKKLSELANHLGLFIEQKPEQIPEGSDLAGIFGFLFDTLQNPSLVVSIPVLHCWTKLLRSPVVRDSSVVNSMVGGLLETCCARLIRYEALPEDTEDVTLQFLNEDIDTVPERHAFLGNYRRFCADVVEVLVRRTPVEAMEHILGRATNMLQTLYSDHPPFQPQTFSKTSAPALRVDAQVTVIEAALKGYLKWLSSQGEDPQQDERKRNAMENSLEEWGRQILQARFEDPEIAKKIITLMSTLATRALGDRPAFALTFLEYMLTIRLADNTTFPQYSETVKELERVCSLEMQKLAMKFADDFMNVYGQLESKVNELIADPTTDERQRMAYSAFLFIIIHRCTTLDRGTQEERMRQMLNQVKDAWRSEELTKSVSEFQSFCGVLGMRRLPDFLSASNFRGVQDWSEQPLNSDGQAMQASMLEQSQHLPLRLTKTLLAASTEKLKDGSPAYETAAVLWAEAIPVLLPNLLQLVNHAQAFNDIDSNWSHLPIELQQVIRRVLTDRFWQAGISTESRDDFFSRVSGSKSTYEGFASTVRGTVRQIRESSYYILYSLTRFRESFYGIQDLPGPLSQALFGHAHALTAHHLSVLLTVSTHLIEGCPVQLRQHFLPPMVQGLFRELDRKISSEWNEVARQIAESGDNDDLTGEMKTESILRQLTYSSVSLVAVLLDPRQELSRQDEHDRRDANNQPMCDFILSMPSVLEPILMFCNSTIRVRDTRSVNTVVRVMRSLLPRFKEKSPIRDYFCNDILKSAITSLHEPYFVDCQKELAALIAGVIHLDDEIPRSIILSLPGMGDSYRVDRRLAKLKTANRQDERMQRAIVLDLLSSIKGVSIHEQGKIQRAAPKKRSAFQEQYMSVDQPTVVVRGNSPELAGVANMFGDS
ncbi:ARM repeat-containing protein [Dothidotthia symphoricarpi CBS 119687]|uniref:ARM repeat-containing protein n=1 Tax=Dothidotthia symphoricarpi CBS 119687 TaxID=1392245 RepID=A0A6A6AGZ1_9PLEO|nr:ARM repeat-containing protein [Dothidotthia symphoricarpi CBS 119687]KAF2130157.1 ARM repeat-containing protein [Dothidotthia symphoricarpi CBS 119687]